LPGFFTLRFSGSFPKGKNPGFLLKTFFLPRQNKAVLCPLWMYIKIANQPFAYEEILDSLSSCIVIFHRPQRGENPEIPAPEKNGKKRCFTRRTSDSEHPELFEGVICTFDKGNRFLAPGDELT